MSKQYRHLEDTLAEFSAACAKLHETVETKVKPALAKLNRDALIGSAITVEQLESLPVDLHEEHVVVVRTIIYTGRVGRLKSMLRPRQVRGETLITGKTPDEDVSIRSLD